MVEHPKTKTEESQFDFSRDRTDISDTLLPCISDFYEDYMIFCYTVLVMLLELNLTGKSITWLKMILTKSSVNIRLTSGNMK